MAIKFAVRLISDGFILEIKISGQIMLVEVDMLMKFHPGYTYKCVIIEVVLNVKFTLKRILWLTCNLIFFKCLLYIKMLLSFKEQELINWLGCIIEPVFKSNKMFHLHIDQLYNRSYIHFSCKTKTTYTLILILRYCYLVKNMKLWKDKNYTYS